MSSDYSPFFLLIPRIFLSRVKYVFGHLFEVEIEIVSFETLSQFSSSTLEMREFSFFNQNFV